MMRELTLRRVGGSIEATLPKGMAARFHMDVGDRVLALETERGILLTPYDPKVEKGPRDCREGVREIPERALAQ